MNKIICALAFSLVLCLAATVYSNAISDDLAENVTRLHIIANSDSEADQAVKLKVRDALLQSVRESGKVTDMGELKSVADSVLAENGFNYASETETGRFYFPEKTYKDTVFPSGEYEAVRVILGAGAGKNWWCVMYPPLCFDEDTDGAMSENGLKQLKNTLDSETYELITEKPEIRFKLVEIVNGIMHQNWGL